MASKKFVKEEIQKVSKKFEKIIKDIHNNIFLMRESFDKQLKIIEEKVAKLEKRTVSQRTSEEAEENLVSAEQIMDEWINGEKKDG